MTVQFLRSGGVGCVYPLCYCPLTPWLKSTLGRSFLRKGGYNLGGAFHSLHLERRAEMRNLKMRESLNGHSVIWNNHLYSYLNLRHPRELVKEIYFIGNGAKLYGGF
jgi:hypothetical protein